MSTVEIERKFIVNGFPTGYELLGEYKIYQIYKSTKPEIRCRCAVDVKGEHKYYIAYKGKGDIARREIEMHIPKVLYRLVEKMVRHRPIEKEYKRYRLEDGKVLEVSRVDGGFHYCEVEFNSKEEALNWDIPHGLKVIIDREVTYDNSYKMKNYWVKTRINNIR